MTHCRMHSYHTLNMFSSSMPEMLQGRGWVLAKEYDRVRTDSCA